MDKILIFEDSFYASKHLKETITRYNIPSVEVNSTQELFIKLAHPDEIGLIIIEVLMAKEDGFQVIQKINELHLDIPVVILTADNTKASFVKGIQMGASDYILKPFDEHFLISRVNHQLEHIKRSRQLLKETPAVGQEGPNANIMRMGIRTYLEKEIAKAKKAKYEVSLLLSMFYKDIDQLTPAVQNEYAHVAESLYQRLDSVLFEQDVLIQYGTHSFIGILPMCSEENRHLVDHKFHALFNRQKKTDPELKDYELVNVFVTYPQDASDREAILSKLIEQTKLVAEARHVQSNDFQ